MRINPARFLLAQAQSRLSCKLTFLKRRAISANLSDASVKLKAIPHCKHERTKRWTCVPKAKLLVQIRPCSRHIRCVSRSYCMCI